MRILEWDEHHWVATGGHHAAGQANYCVMVAANFHLIAQPKPGGDVRDRLIVATCNLAPRDQLRWPTRCSRFACRNAHDHGAHILFTSSDLHGQVGHIGGLCDARQGADAAPQVIRDAGRLGIRAQGIFLYHPQVGTTVVQQHLTVIDHAAIHTRHGQRDADQQAQADARKDEFPPSMKDVTSGQAYHGETPGRRSTMLIRLLALSVFSLYSTT